MPSLKTIDAPIQHVRLGCRTCKRYHDVYPPADDGTRILRELDSWSYKHAGHVLEKPVFCERQVPRDLKPLDDPGIEATAPWWHPDSGYRENTNFQTTYVASASLTVTSWATLASDTNLLAGASSAVVDNGASGAPLLIGVTAQIKNGTTPTTAKEIDIFSWCKQDDSTYPDNITGSDAAISASTTEVYGLTFRLCVSFASTTTTGSTYPTGWHTMGLVELASLWGGFLPRYWGLWIVHNTVAAFASGSVAAQKGLYVAG